MDLKNSNTCKILINREILQNPISCYNLISDKLKRKTELLYKRDLVAHYGCVNAIEFSNNGQYLVSGGDDRRVLLWNVQKALHNSGKPSIMLSEHHSNIFCLSFDNSVTHIYSAGNDDQVILHDIQTGKVCDVFNLGNPVYGISVDPCNDNIFASAGEDGRILIFDTRLDPSNDPYQLASFKDAFHAVMFNPIDPRLITTANSKKGAALWDIRVADKTLMQYGRKDKCMNVRWDQTGTKILVLRRKEMPVLYDFNHSKRIAQFFHNNYYNSCTMKSCCFAGLKDEYVLSGSDDFNLYMWKISDAMNSLSSTNNAHLVLRGHRSIVNQVRFDPYNCVIASSGVEKIIKIWSPMSLPFSTKDSNTCIRKRYTHDEYISLIIRSGQFMSHDYSEQSTSEDPQMMAFFDSLVQRDREGQGNSDDSSEDNTLCTNDESYEDTDYSSLSDDCLISPTRCIVPADLDINNFNNENESSTSAEATNVDENLTVTNGNESCRRYCKPCKPKSNTRHSFNLRLSPSLGNNDCNQLTKQSSSSSITSFIPTSATSTSTTSLSSSTDSETAEDRLSGKRKLKSRTNLLQRLKRACSIAFQPPSSSSGIDSVSERSVGSSGASETSTSSGGISTDTVDSGVYLRSSPSPPKYKFVSFKKNEKRRYRSRRKSSSSSISSSDTD